MEDKKEILTDEKGFLTFKEALEQSKAVLEEKYRERAAMGKNRIGSDGDYQTGIADAEIQIAANAVRMLEDTISRLVVVSEDEKNEAEVGFGDIVSLLHLDTNEVRQVKVSGGSPSFDFDSEIIPITINSPMGKAIYKRKVGETVSYSVGKNTFTVTILTKEPSEAQKEKTTE